MEVKKKLMAGIDDSDLVLLKFTISETETELIWKNAGEFEYKGQMYDIAIKRQDGDTTWYYCLKDDKETRLNKEKYQLLARSAGQDPCQKSQKDRIKDFFKIVYGKDIFSWTSYAPFSKTFQFLIFNFQCSSLSLSPPSPPPKLDL